MSVRAISLNGVNGVLLKGNRFDNTGGGNITDNLCECCTVVETPQSERCVGVRAFV